LKFATLRRVAPAQTLPRGERGPRLATDLQPRPVPQSTPPKPISVSAGFVFSKTEYWDQLPSLSSELKREDSHGALFAPGFPYEFSGGILCSAYTRKVSYPGLTAPCATVAYTVREECEKRAGEHRENGAGEDRDPLQDTIDGTRLVPHGTFADHFRVIDGKKVFRCFGCVSRVPVSWQHGLAAWRFSSCHSIATEAAVKFLVTPTDVEELWSRMQVPSKLHEGEDALHFHRPELAPTLEELGLVFQVTCSITDPDALNLRPGVPRNHLHIDDTKLIQVIQPKLRSLSSLGYDPAATKDE
jgi:hypothetical protein